MPWIEIKIAVPEPIKDSVINRLFELGAEGVSESDAPPAVHGFFEQARSAAVTEELEKYLESVATLFPQLPRAEIVCKDVQEENWAENYKRFYKAQKMTNLFFLKPAWDEETRVPEEMIPIVMEPGQAFGTGLHPSTCMAMRFLEWAVALYPDPARVRLLDVGTGTGILAIAASKLGVGDIGAMDIDPEAVSTAKENFRRNGCSGIEVRAGELSEWKGPIDVLVSNILLETHKQLVGEYRRLLRPGGHLILSGLLVPQRGEIDEIFLKHGFLKEMERSMQEWASVAYTWREKNG